ncbi:unnamed protein product [Pleuronectes platessa]|uniref:Uncharacterized protein n=1 Tax=Pleuronectes platessa TaxID=8262 RepID=A0A9N7VZL9_PLEPL|nr:unnamed protein product [Pleuronectes platessa]
MEEEDNLKMDIPPGLGEFVQEGREFMADKRWPEWPPCTKTRKWTSHLDQSLHITPRLAESPHLQCGKKTPFCLYYDLLRPTMSQYEGASSSSIRTLHQH